MQGVHGVRHRGNINRMNRQSGQSFRFVFDSVAMHDVHDYSQSAFVGFVDKLFKLVRSAEP